MRYLIIPVLIAVAACSSTDLDDATDAVRRELTDGPSAEFRRVAPCPSGQGYFGQVSSINDHGVRSRFINFVYEEGSAALAGFGEEYAELRPLCAATPQRG